MDAIIYHNHQPALRAPAPSEVNFHLSASSKSPLKPTRQILDAERRQPVLGVRRAALIRNSGGIRTPYLRVALSPGEEPPDSHVHLTKMLFSSLSAAVNWARSGAVCVLHGA